MLNFHTVPWMKKTKCYPVLSLVPTYSTFTAPNKRMALPLPPPVSIISLRTDREHISINQNFKKEKEVLFYVEIPFLIATQRYIRIKAIQNVQDSN